MEAVDPKTLQCEKVGEVMPDIAGIGVDSSRLRWASLHLLGVVLLGGLSVKTRQTHFSVRRRYEEHEAEKKRLKLVSDILMVGNDVQMLTGIALLITAFSQYGMAGDEDRIDLYHLHLIFDTVSFVGVSNCSALICWTFMAAKLPYMSSPVSSGLKQSKNHHLSLTSARHRAGYVFALCFLVLTILLELRLNDWKLESEELGNCFRDGLTAITSASQPGSAKTYVAVTATWLLGCMITLFIGGTKR
ncbi:hypothetical protein TruAng_000306 [Truncatella angustata]|nr:hypothetical protein TruAng_000306 [Truncatella angustata]